jgi:ribosome-binding protein aMBF1 (putative translation factor)
MAVKRRKFKSAALQWTYDRYVGNDPQEIEAFEQEVINAEIAQKIYDLRTKAGLSQRELAKKVGTTASAICRLEDADYEGHSLSMLKRIAEALDKRLEIRFVSTKKMRVA